jgi:hypothetical protein
MGAAIGAGWNYGSCSAERANRERAERNAA